VVYYDGTKLANNSLVTYDGNTFELTNAPADQPFFNINGAQTISTTTASAVDMGATVVDSLGSGTYTYFNAGPTYRPTAAKPAFIGFSNTLSIDDSSGASSNITTLTGYQGAFTGASGYTGLITTYRGINLLNPTLNGASMTSFIPIAVQAQSSASNTAAIVIGDHTSVGNNASIATGATSIPTGDWDAYFAADYPSAFVASTTALTSDALVMKSARAAIAAGNILGGLAWWSDDTNLTAPGIKTAGIQALANVAHTGSALDTDLTFSVTNGTTLYEAMRLTDTGNLGLGTTSPSARLTVAGGDFHLGGKLTATSTATSTFSGPVQSTCFTTDGSTCLTGGSSLSGGVLNTLTYWTGASTVGATSSPTVGSITATSTATSTFTGDVSVNDHAISGKLYDANNSAGTSGQVLSSTGTGIDWIDAGSGSAAVSSSSIVAYLSSTTPTTTWTKPAKLLYVRIQVLGPGGRGGSGGATSNAGGGAGGYCVEIIPAANLGATETVTVGGGQNTDTGHLPLALTAQRTAVPTQRVLARDPVGLLQVVT
jgi:hypothetical protein